MKLSSKNKKTFQAEPVTKSDISASGVRKISFFRLGLVSFVCGTMVMVLEMTGSRMLAPYLGTSIIVWTSLIGIVLASLSFGYWYGGIFADKYPDPRVLGKIIFVAAILIALVGGGYTFVLGPLSSGKTSLYVSAVSAALVLFAVPGALLGMVSPFVARLALDDLGSSGTIVGRLYALSSIGSILGTFLGGFVLITLLKTGTILFLIAAVLLGVTLLLLDFSRQRSSLTTAMVLIPLFFFCGGLYQVYGNKLLPTGYHEETPYNHIRVYETDGGKVRAMQTDPGGAAQSFMFVDRPTELVSRYVKYNELAFYGKPDIKRVLIIGGGGYCIPKNLLATRPEVEIDVVEIDPGITAIARRFFALEDNPRLRIYHEDARRFLRRMKMEQGERKYDFIFGDAFNSAYNLPFHLTTKEYMQEVFEQLSEDGIFMTNIIASTGGRKHRLFRGFYQALAEVFPQVEAFSVHDPNEEIETQNIVLLGSKKKFSLEVSPETPPRIAEFMNHRYTRSIPKDTPALTDAFAPVEMYVLE